MAAPYPEKGPRIKDEESKPVFVLGVGAQKAGTTWLHRQLAAHPRADMGMVKEYHVWDAVFVESCRMYLWQPEDGETPERALLRRMQSVDGVYETYFRSLVSGGVGVTGDMTPSYACLDASHLAIIRERLERAGFTVKVVFLMRDPVERNWSALRMMQRNRSERGVAVTDDDLLARFEAFYARPGMVERTRYDRTVTALRAAFETESLHFGFFETLFTDASMRDLSDFLGLDLSWADADEKINASRPLALPRHLQDRCREYFSEVYEFCHDQFPETRDLWAAGHRKDAGGAAR